MPTFTLAPVRALLGSLVLCAHSALPVQAAEVDVFYPTSEPAYQTLTLTGTVEAAQNADLASLQAGVIQQFFVEVGDKVSRGQKLMTLDATLARLTLAETEASVTSSEIRLREAKRLYQEALALSEQQAMAQTLIAQRKAAVATAEAALNREKSNLAYQKELVNRHTLYAPFNGVISRRNGDVGEWVTQQRSVLGLVQQDKLRLVISIPQEYYQFLKEPENTVVTITPDVTEAAKLTGKISRYVAVSNEQSRAFTAHIDLPASDSLTPGMSANAELQFNRVQKQLVWLPKRALKQHPDGGTSVFAVVNGQAERFIVDVVDKKEQQIAVTGAPANHAYVTSGVALLRDGESLTIKNTEGQRP
ncbi:efflux RND transporter periplasmic adaptor subunit [Porticoccus sp. W117]|uniref:efflux RND transporter periplasmic adaptor subunit n=1 Tax=Porticoccus sp. W117 TaxID=3054777 RepID=UPI00259A7477|nr:efflux RND transporter periplasmic adaptor subunit [Porticoccus sp. W117]MDM3871514.1 efflux RND transporter periplasmic adaptor subunit [Porticoccus sp. W117]